MRGRVLPNVPKHVVGPVIDSTIPQYQIAFPKKYTVGSSTPFSMPHLPPPPPQTLGGMDAFFPGRNLSSLVGRGCHWQKYIPMLLLLVKDFFLSCLFYAVDNAATWAALLESVVFFVLNASPGAIIPLLLLTASRWRNHLEPTMALFIPF